MSIDAATSADTTKTLTFWQLICFGLLTTPLAIGGLALVVYLPTYYAVDLGLGLGFVGFIFVIGRFLDIFTDPLVGHWSDETRSRWGPRRPWMIVGVIGFTLSAWFFLAPPQGATPIYLIIISSLYFLFYTVLDVPYSSIGLEISPHVHERSFLASSKAVFQVTGAIFAASLPFILAISIAQSLEILAQTIAVLCGLGIILFLLFVPNKSRPVSRPRLGLIKAGKEVFKSKRYRYLIGSFLIVQTANSFTAGLTVLYVTHIIGAPQLVGMFLGLLLLSSAMFLPLWVFISKRFDKKTAWIAAILSCTIILAMLPILGEGDVIGAAIFCFIIGGTFGCDSIMPTSMLADIVYDNEKSGNNRLAGLCLAVKNAVSKLSFVAPMGLAFPILGLIDFEKTEPGDLMAKSIFLIFYAGLPIILRLIAIWVLRNAPEMTSGLASSRDANS